MTRSPRRAAAVLGALLAALTLAACGSSDHPALTHSETVKVPASLLAGMRPIGPGRRFHPPVTGRPTGACRAKPGPYRAHIELFAANRVLLIPGGVGHRGRCDGNVVTTDPTGIVHYRRGATLRELFRAWGQPLTRRRLASFTGTVRYYVAGKRVTALPALKPRAEIVLEVGAYVPPHKRFTFPRGL